MCIPLEKRWNPALPDIFFYSGMGVNLITARDELHHAACNLCISLGDSGNKELYKTFKLTLSCIKFTASIPSLYLKWHP